MNIKFAHYRVTSRRCGLFCPAGKSATRLKRWAHLYHYHLSLGVLVTGDKPKYNAASMKKAFDKSKKRYKSAGRLFSRVNELNKLIEQGGEVAKDARAEKNRLSHESSQFHYNKAKKPKRNSKKKRKKGGDCLDSYKKLPGSFESGKRR